MPARYIRFDVCVVQPLVAARRRNHVQGSHLALIDLMRSRPGATRISLPLKALDRLLDSSHLHDRREQIYKAITR